MVLTHEVSIPFGLVLLAGAALSFLTTQSVFALVLGVVSGVFIAYLGYEMKVSYNENVEAKKFQSPTYSYCISSALVAVLNALLNGDRFMQNTGDVVALGVALASLAAGALFVYKASSDDVGTHAKRSKQW